MKLLRNAQTLLTRPEIAWDYLQYRSSRWKNSGKAVRVFSRNLKISGLSGFSEFHSCKNFVNDQERQFLQNFDFGEGDMIDVGANLGVVSLYLAERSPWSTVHAFEANPTTFEALQGNIALNKCSNIRANNLAIAGHEGCITFNANPIHRGTTSITRDTDSYTVDIPCITLDAYSCQQPLQKIKFRRC